MRLRDLPGLAARLEEIYEQAKGYYDRIPRKRKRRKNPYTHAK